MGGGVRDGLMAWGPRNVLPLGKGHAGGESVLEQLWLNSWLKKGYSKVWDHSFEESQTRKAFRE